MPNKEQVDGLSAELCNRAKIPGFFTNPFFVSCSHILAHSKSSEKIHLMHNLLHCKTLSVSGDVYV